MNTTMNIQYSPPANIFFCKNAGRSSTFPMERGHIEKKMLYAALTRKWHHMSICPSDVINFRPASPITVTIGVRDVAECVRTLKDIPCEQWQVPSRWNEKTNSKLTFSLFGSLGWPSYMPQLESSSVMNHARWGALGLFPNVSIFQSVDIVMIIIHSTTVLWNRNRVRFMCRERTTRTIHTLHLILARWTSPGTSTWFCTRHHDQTKCFRS